MWHVWWIVCDWSQFESNSQKFGVPLNLVGQVISCYTVDFLNFLKMFIFIILISTSVKAFTINKLNLLPVAYLKGMECQMRWDLRF